MPNPDIEDLWPSDLGLETVVTPVSLLRTQAKLLGVRTQGMLEGEVQTWTQGENVCHELNVVVPALDDYKYRILKVHHPAMLYPVFVDEEPTADGRIRFKPTPQAFGEGGLNDEQALREWLKRALARPETKQILSHLYAQATQ